MKQFFKFVTVGLINTVVGYSIIFSCMYLLDMSPERSNVTGYASGLILSYVLNRNFTFSSKKNQFNEILRFASVFFIAFSLNFFVLVMLVRIGGFNEGLSQLIAGSVYVAAFYLMSKFYVFKDIANQ